MTKLNWEYAERGGTYGNGYQFAEYNGLVIKAMQNDSPMNPFDDWDCEPPTAVYSSGSLTEYKGGPLDCLTGISDGFLRRNSAKLAKALDLDPAAFHAESLESQRGYGGRLIDHKREALEAALSDLGPGSGSSAIGDYFAAVAAVWAARGVIAVDWSSNGYSQSDWAVGISVATPDWAKLTGAPADSHARQCEAAGKLWGAWAWGDVYGYAVAEPGEDGEVLDSCWGYYGSDHAESGLEESALDAAEWIIGEAAKRRAAMLKTLIANRVPLALRPAKLATAGAFKESDS